jgi:hypothetical protein
MPKDTKKSSKTRLISSKPSEQISKLEDLADLKNRPWFINSEEDFYYFWKYIQRKSDVGGDMPPLEALEISRLLALPKEDLQTHLDHLLLNLKKSKKIKDLFFK